MKNAKSNIEVNLIGASEAARRLEVSEQSVRNYQSKGILPGFRLANGHRVFQRQDVEALKARRDSLRQDVGGAVNDNDTK